MPANIFSRRIKNKKMLRNTLVFLLTFSGFLTFAQNNFFVSASGSDANTGTSVSSPFATIEKALGAVAKIDKNVAGNTVLTINEGVYQLANPLAIDEFVGGNPKHPVTIKAALGATVKISGGVSIKDWVKTSGKPYFQKTLTLSEVRDLYVDGERRTRARTNERITGLNWVLEGMSKVGMLIDQNKLPAIANTSQLEFHMQSEWRDAYVPIQSMTSRNGVWDIRSNRLNEVTSLTPLPAVPSFTIPFFVENALELLDQPGEWYFDRTSKTIYYYPKLGENINNLEMLAPVLDRLIDIRGSRLSNKVRNVTIEGIQFAHTAWNLPSNEGWYGWQAAEHLVRPANVLTPPGAIIINNASNIVIQNCKILNTAVSGIAMPNGVNNSRIEGCYFFDNGGAAIQVSNRDLIAINVEGEEAPANDTLRNNLIVKAGAAFYGSPAISSYYTDRLVIDHNTILQSPYTAISVGFGWETISQTCKNNKITNNKIIDYLAICTDGGGIYTLGNQPNSLVENNYIKNGIRDWAGLYFDQGSAFFTVRNNVVENATRWLHIWKSSIYNIVLSNNWSNVASFLNRGTNITYESPLLVTGGNWPSGAQNIIKNAGFNPSYVNLTALLPSALNAKPVVTIEGSASRNISLIDQLVLKANVGDDGKPFGILHTEWRKKSGPGTITFPTASETSTLAFFSTAGTYEIELIAQDNQDSTKATVQVVVSNINLGTNLALNKKATATSSFDASTYVADKAVDGEVNSIWVSGVSDGNFSTWTLDFGSVVSLKRLELVARRGFDFKDTRQHLLFEVSDEPSFSSPKIVAFQGEKPFDSEGTWAYNFSGTVSCRYIRLSHSRAGGNTIAEFRAFADPNMILGIDDEKKEGAFNFNIYPNPVIGNTVMVDISGNNPTQGARIELFSVEGKRVDSFGIEKSSKIQTVGLDVSHLSTGTYLLCMSSDNERVTKKLIVHK
jgi:hypothetical protein